MKLERAPLQRQSCSQHLIKPRVLHLDKALREDL